MKSLVLALVLAVCGDVALNHHRYTSQVLGQMSELVRGSSDEISGSVFRS